MGPPSLPGTEKEWTRADMPSSSFVVDDLRSEASTSGSSGPYIEHIVTRLDTLAGVAIKYGVEVADIKRLNGLTTDLQMFALKALRIPTPGRHPPGSRFENGPSTSHLHPAGSHDHSLSSSKTQETSTMALLRNYYGLPSAAGEDGVEMATINLDKETGDATFVPVHRPPNSTHSRRHSTGDYRTCGCTRESCNHILGSCWSTNAPESTETSLLMKPSKEISREGELSSKERPIRRRTRDDVSDKVNFSKRNPAAPRVKDSNSSEGPTGMKSIRGALLGRKESVEGLLSKVMPITTPATSQEGGRPLHERVPSTGSFNLFEDNWQRARILETVVEHYPLLQTKSGPSDLRDLRFSES